MKDVIWTLIVVWLVYRLVDVFRSVTTKKSFVENNAHAQQQHTSSDTGQHPKKDLKTALQKHLNKEGEYVDFEEIQ